MAKKAPSDILIREETSQNETVQSLSHLVNPEQEFHRISCLTQSPGRWLSRLHAHNLCRWGHQQGFPHHSRLHPKLLMNSHPETFRGSEWNVWARDLDRWQLVYWGIKSTSSDHKNKNIFPAKLVAFGGGRQSCFENGKVLTYRITSCRKLKWNTFGEPESLLWGIMTNQFLLAGSHTTAPGPVLLYPAQAKLDRFFLQRREGSFCPPETFFHSQLCIK